MRQLAIINQSSLISTADLQAAIAALQIQVSRDFANAWGLSAQLVPALSGQSGAPNMESIYLLDDTDQADALGYHTLDAHEHPVGYVFVKTTLDASDEWQATLSHELLEQLLDPMASAAAIVPFLGHPYAAVAYEACDAVENDEYPINGIPLSNFVLPGWFAPGFTGRVDFMGLLKGPLSLDAGGYVAYSANLRSWQQTFGEFCPARQRTAQRYSRRHRRFGRQVGHAWTPTIDAA